MSYSRLLYFRSGKTEACYTLSKELWSVLCIALIWQWCTFGSPFEKMNSLVSLKDHKAKWCECEESWIPRYILKETNNPRHKHNSTACFNIQGIFLFTDVNVNLEIAKQCLKKHYPTLHGCGSTPYVSSIWAFCRKFRSDVSGVCPLREGNNIPNICVSLP